MRNGITRRGFLQLLAAAPAAAASPYLQSQYLARYTVRLGPVVEREWYRYRVTVRRQGLPSLTWHRVNDGVRPEPTLYSQEWTLQRSTDGGVTWRDVEHVGSEAIPIAIR